MTEICNFSISTALITSFFILVTSLFDNLVYPITFRVLLRVHISNAYLPGIVLSKTFKFPFRTTMKTRTTLISDSWDSNYGVHCKWTSLMLIWSIWCLIFASSLTSTHGQSVYASLPDTSQSARCHPLIFGNQVAFHWLWYRLFLLPKLFGLFPVSTGSRVLARAYTPVIPLF